MRGHRSHERAAYKNEVTKGKIKRKEGKKGAKLSLFGKIEQGAKTEIFGLLVGNIPLDLSPTPTVTQNQNPIRLRENKVVLVS